MTRFRTTLLAFAVLACCSIGPSRAFAQEQDTAPPKPTARVYLPLIDTNQQDEQLLGAGISVRQPHSIQDAGGS